MTLRIAYLVNQYPLISHTFIRREILAVERQGVEVLRIALRGWAGDVYSEDKNEQTRTRYILKGGPLPLLLAAASTFFSVPRLFLSALRLTIRMAKRSDRGLFYHWAYLAEACLILPWLTDAKISHVHAHFGTNSAEVAMFVHQLGGPTYSFTAHGSETVDGAQFVGLGEKIRRARFVVAVCSFGRAQLFRTVEFRHWKKIHVVHCGLEAAFYQVAPVPMPKSPRLVCVGRLCEQKGQLLLVEAARRLDAKGHSFEIVLAGDGEMRPAIEQLISENGLESKVFITGWISSEEVRENILAARGLVLPSFSEGLPVVLMEAMSLRRPVLTTYVGGIPELVKSGVSGWLFPAGSIDALTETIEVFLSKSSAELQNMGDAAYERVLERHRVDIEAARLIELFRDA
jgi:colanic acid/amylovoran biosynthesis glycosyltransferase